MAIKFEINMTNKWLYSLITIGVLLFLGVGVYAYTQSIPNPGHGADTIWISIEGEEKTLQDLIDSGIFEKSLSLSCVTIRAYENNSYFVVDGSGIASDIVNFVPSQGYPVWVSELIGIVGKDNWILTGCTHTSDSGDTDSFMFENGCFFDETDGGQNKNLIDARFCKIS